ncbi:MAG TPA: 2OG-Fe(II) oxygenase [Xanthobacteraceae bacterium]
MLGEAMVAKLLDYVAARRTDFKSSVGYGESHELRSSLSLTDPGPFKAPIENFVRGIAASAFAELNVAERVGEPEVADFAAYRDGDHFGAHIDTTVHPTRVRVVTCVYYFAMIPHRFSGGDLRLYGLRTFSGSGSASVVDVAPETDTMVVFPSWLRHEVLPVRVPSGAWGDSRFSLNCVLHRVQRSAVSKSADARA